MCQDTPTHGPSRPAAKLADTQRVALIQTDTHTGQVSQELLQAGIRRPQRPGLSSFSGTADTKTHANLSHTTTAAGGYQAMGSRAMQTQRQFCNRDSHGPAHTGAAAGGHQATRARALHPGSRPPRWQPQPAGLRCPHPAPAQAAWVYLQAGSNDTLRIQSCTPV